MEIEKGVVDLDEEIAELHNYASLIEDKKNNQLLSLITIIGALLLIPTFIASFYGMNIFDSTLSPYSWCHLFVTTTGMALISLTSFWIFTSYFGLAITNNKSNERKWLSAFLIILVSFLLIIPLTRCEQKNPPAFEIQQDSVINHLQRIENIISDTTKNYQNDQK